MPGLTFFALRSLLDLTEGLQVQQLTAHTPQNGTYSKRSLDMNIDARSAVSPSCPFSQLKAQGAATSNRCASLAHSTLLPRAGPAADLAGLAHQRRSSVAQALFGRSRAAAPVACEPALSPCAGAARSSVALFANASHALVSRRRRATLAATLVAHAPRALVSRECRALNAAVIVACSSRADSALA